MTDELRVKVIKDIQTEKSKMKKLKKKLEQIEELEQDENVKKYLKLISDVKDQELLSDKEIYNDFAEYNKDFVSQCTHDIYYCSEELSGSREVIYYCFECNSQQSNYVVVRIREIAEFEKTHRVIHLPKTSEIDINNYRARYFELLQTHTTDEAYEILEQELKEEKEELSKTLNKYTPWLVQP